LKGIVLAGGAGTRLHPLTVAISKQLVPVYNKPMIYYPISTLMLAGIRQIQIITTPFDQERFRLLLGDGSDIGVEFSYAVQPRPEGIAQALLIAADFIGDDDVALILGDNLFFGHGLPEQLQRVAADLRGATILAYKVRDPERYGVVELDERGRPVGIEEKPREPRSSLAVAGMYFYDSRVVDLAGELRPSARGELEITDLNLAYMRRGELDVDLLGRGIAWLDTGTHQSLLEASEFVQVVEQRQGLMIGSIEEVAHAMGFIDTLALIRAAEKYANNDYGQYLMRIAGEEARR
jgi:glucose-1-phosphate thymidylyltransferase